MRRTVKQIVYILRPVTSSEVSVFLISGLSYVHEKNSAREKGKRWIETA